MDASQLQEQDVRVQRALIREGVGAVVGVTVALLLVSSCSSLPATHYEKFTFPKDVYVGDVKDRPYTVLGQVRTREDYQTLDQTHDEDDLCKNYFYKGARDLLKLAHDQHADAVVGVKSVTFNADGTTQTYDTPQCADDGQNGQILMQGIAVTWGKTLVKTVALVEPSSQRFRTLRLKQDEDGMDGGLYFVVSNAKADSLVLYTMERKIIAGVPAGAPDAWLTAEFLRSPKERTILMNSPDTGGDVVSRPLSIDQGKLAILQAQDFTTRKPAPLVLTRGKTADWRMSDSDPRDLLQVSKDSYIRYHFDLHDGWTRISKAASGDWDASKPFPPEASFPQLTYSAK